LTTKWFDVPGPTRFWPSATFFDKGETD
jgi:hypothetical protein